MGQFNEFENEVDFTFWRDFCLEKGKPLTLARGEFFAHAGDVLSHVGWIESGAFKHSVADNEGNEKATGFVFAGSVLANYESMLLKRPSLNDIIALEDSTVLVVPAALVREIFEKDPAMHLRVVQALFSQAYRTAIDHYRCTPEQHYRLLLERYPRIFNLVTLGEIASYLNISRRQLHRIRESLARR